MKGVSRILHVEQCDGSDEQLPRLNYALERTLHRVSNGRCSGGMGLVKEHHLSTFSRANLWIARGEDEWGVRINNVKSLSGTTNHVCTPRV